MAIFRPSARQMAAAAAFVSLQALLPGLAHAQSAYTLSVLNKPLGTDLTVPTSLDNQGVVHGGLYIVNRYQIGFGEGGCTPLFIVLMCPRHGQREATWPASTAASVTAKAGLRGFVSALSNDVGSQVGAWDPERSRRQMDLYLQPDVQLIRVGSWAQNNLALSDGAFEFLASNGTQTPVSPLQGTAFMPRAMNNSNTVVGGTAVYAAERALVWRQGVLTTLPVAFNGAATAHDINDAGVIVGASSASDFVDPDTGRTRLRPTRWVNDQPEFLGGTELLNMEAVAINNAGQVLIHSSTGSTESHVWAEGTLTKLETPPGQSPHPTAMNDQGTVVGCTRTIKDYYTLTRADLTAVIWRNGVMQDLTQLLSSKGLKLPSGTRLGCPSAINKQGSMLGYYYKVSSPDTITWVRINAKP